MPASAALMLDPDTSWMENERRGVQSVCFTRRTRSVRYDSAGTHGTGSLHYGEDTRPGCRSCPVHGSTISSHLGGPSACANRHRAEPTRDQDRFGPNEAYPRLVGSPPRTGGPRATVLDNHWAKARRVTPSALDCRTTPRPMPVIG